MAALKAAERERIYREKASGGRFMSAWVTDVPDMNGRSVPLERRGAWSGAYLMHHGLDLDLKGITTAPWSCWKDGR